MAIQVATRLPFGQATAKQITPVAMTMTTRTGTLLGETGHQAEAGNLET
jgi:hypothetical protein